MWYPQGLSLLFPSPFPRELPTAIRCWRTSPVIKWFLHTYLICGSEPCAFPFLCSLFCHHGRDHSLGQRPFSPLPSGEPSFLFWPGCLTLHLLGWLFIPFVFFRNRLWISDRRKTGRQGQCNYPTLMFPFAAPWPLETLKHSEMTWFSYHLVSSTS